ncbi:MAG TPA: flagellar biosynthetic protein FliO [Bryobacteraceae bacterium]|nr:flagellar biosynthetic protein FliO [Bryobacteraceae bacterium]
MQQFGAVGLVLLMLWATAWLLKRKAGMPLVTSKTRRGVRRMEELDRTRLTAQHSLHLIRVDQRTMILAVHPGGVVVVDGMDPAVDAGAAANLRYGER